MGVLTFRNFGILERLVASGYLELIEDIEVTGSSVTSVQFSGFTATKEDTLMLVSEISTTITSSYDLNFNNNLTTTNYYVQRLLVNSTTVAGNRQNNNFFADCVANDKVLAISNIKLTNDGYGTTQTEVTKNYVSNTPWMFNYNGSSIFTMTSITQLDVIGTTNGIGIGSRFQLYKVVA